MVFLVARPQPFENLDRFVEARLFDHHFLEPTCQSTVTLDVLELVECGRADDPELAGRQHGLDERGQVHRAPGRRSGADGRMHLVDEQDRHRPARKRVDDRLEPFFEIASEAGAGEQGRRVQREHLGAAELPGNIVIEEPLCQALGQGGLADTGIADEHGVVLAAPTQDLDRPLQLLGAADQGVELAACGALGQVDRERGQRVARRGGAVAVGTGLGSVGRLGIGCRGRHLGDAVRDVVQDVEPCDVL